MRHTANLTCADPDCDCEVLVTIELTRRYVEIEDVEGPAECVASRSRSDWSELAEEAAVGEAHDRMPLHPYAQLRMGR